MKRARKGPSSKLKPSFCGLFLAGVDDALLPVDQGAVAVGGHPFDGFEAGKGHGERGIMPIGAVRAAPRRRIGCRRAAGAPHMDLLEYQGKQLFAKHGIAVPSGEVAGDRRGGRRRRRADRLPLRDQGPGADRRPRQGRRDQDRRRRRGGARSTPTRSSAWTSSARTARAPSGSTRSGSRAAPTSPPSTTPRSSSTAARRSCWRWSPPRAGWTSRRSPPRTPTRWSKRHIDPTREFDAAAARPIVDDAGLDEDVLDAGRRGAGRSWPRWPATRTRP